MLGQLAVGFSEDLLTPALVVPHSGTAIIRGKDFGSAAKELKHMDMRCNPVRCGFIQETLHIGILAVGHDAHEQPNISDLAGVRGQ
jgi:hypothetical protein